jgi:protein TonB
MDINKLLRADYLDIVFDGRNKSYGSYELRRKYGRRSRRAGVIVIASALLLSGIPTLASMMGKRPELPRIAETIVHILPPPVPPNPEVLPPPPPPPSHTPEVEPPPSAQFADPRVTPDEFVEKPPPTQDDLHDKVAALKDGDGTGNPFLETTPGDPNGRPGGTGVESSVSERLAPVKFVEQMPEFRGDIGAWLSAHLRYPDAAREMNITGRSIIEFVVNEDGSIEAARVARSSHSLLDAEALRVVSSMPKWKAGKQNGKAVRVLFTLPIGFQLD